MLSTGTVVLSTAKATAPPVLVGSANVQTVLLVQNRGPLRVMVGSREDLQTPGAGIVVAPLETYVHTGPDGLYAVLDPYLADVAPVVAITLLFNQYLNTAGTTAPISGAQFPWPTGPDWGAS